jgi:Phage integrase family
VKKVAARAGISAEIGTHTLRHAFCEHVVRHAGLPAAQAAMGHATLATTEVYLGQMTFDEVALAMAEVTLGTNPPEHVFPVGEIEPARPGEAPTGIEPVYTALQAAA